MALRRVLLAAVLVLVLLPLALTRSTRPAAAAVGDPLPCPLSTQSSARTPTDPFGDPIIPSHLETAVLWPDDSGLIVPGRGVWSPDGDRAVIDLPLDRALGSDGYAPAVAAWDGSDPIVLDLPPHLATHWRTYQVAWAPDSEHVAVSYVEDNDPAVTALFDRSGTLLSTLDAELLEWSPTGTHLAGTAAGDGVVVDIIDAPATIVPLGLGAAPKVLEWSSDGTWLAAVTTGASPAAAVVRSDGTGAQVLGAAVSDVSWRPGTHELAWVPAAAAATGGLSVHDAEAATERPVTVPLATSARLPRWSPDGTRLALAGGGQVWILPAADDGSLAQGLGPSAVEGETGRWISHLAWAPDGGRLAYVVVRRGLDPEFDWLTASDAGTIDPDDPGASQPQRITSDFLTPNGAGQATVVALRWARDGTQVALDVDVVSPNWPWEWSRTAVLAGDLDVPTPGTTRTFPSYPCDDGAVPATAETPAVPMPPPLPHAPVASTVQVADTEVTLRWLVPWAPIAGMRTGWQVRRSDDAAVLDIPVADRATATVPTGAPGTVVTFEVRAVGAGGTSAWVAFPPVTMPATRTLTGVVTGAGQPVSGATVRLQDATTETSDDLTTTTAADGTWALGPVEVQADWTLVVEDPTGTFVSQHLAGIVLPSRASTHFPVELSPAAVDADGAGSPVQLEGALRRAVELPNKDATPDRLSYAVSTDQEVALLDAHGRLRVRVLDRPGADGVCRAGDHIAINRGDRVDFVTSTAARTSIHRSTALPASTNGDIGCINFDAYVVLPDEGEQPPRLAKVQSSGPVVPADLPTGIERVDGSGRLVLWGPGGVRVQVDQTLVAEQPGPVEGFGADDEVVITGAPHLAWSSSGWRLDLTSGVLERVVAHDAPTVDVAPGRGVLALAGSLFDDETGAAITELPGTLASAFATDEQRLLVVDADGSARVSPAPGGLATVHGVVSGDGGPVAGATVTLSGFRAGTQHTALTGADGSYALTDVPTAPSHTLHVEPPDASLVDQTLTGFGLEDQPELALDVELSPTDLTAADTSASVSLPGDVRRMAPITDPSPFAGGLAVSTTEEVAVLDPEGRLRLRIVERAGAAGVASTFDHLVIHRGDSMDFALLQAPWTVRSVPVSPSTHGDVAAHWSTVSWVIAPTHLTPPRLARRDLSTAQYASSTPLESDQRLVGIGDHPGGAGLDLLLWGDGSVQTVRSPITGTVGSTPPPDPLPPIDSTGFGFGVDEEVVGSTELRRAWASDGWMIDLATGTRTPVLPVDGDHISLSADRRLLVQDGQVLRFDGAVLATLPAAGPSGFLGDGATIAVAGPGGVVHLVASPPPPHAPPSPITDLPTLDATGVWLTWTTTPVEGAPVTSWEIIRDDSDEVVTVPAGQLSAFLPRGTRATTVTFSIRAVGPTGPSAWVDFAPVAMPVFTDVGVDHPFRSEIEQAHALGLVNGYTDGSFRPGAPVSRQAAVAFLWRAAGEPTGHLAPGFSDVPANHPFRDAIAWAAAEGITTGYPDGTFRPGNPVTRQAWIAFLWRTDDQPAVDPTCEHPGFPDVPTNHPFHTAITWAACEGITTGYTDGTFRPTATVTRQAAAAILVRAS